MRMSYKNGTTKGKTPTTPKEKKLAALAEPKNKITFGDVVAGRKKAMGGGMMRRTFKKGGSGKDTHVTKDGRTVKKGLYYYMNRAKKSGKSKPGKGSVTDKALKASAKTAKKA